MSKVSKIIIINYKKITCKNYFVKVWMKKLTGLFLRVDSSLDVIA